MNDAVNLAGGQFAGAEGFGFFADEAEDFGFGSGEADIVSEADEDSARDAALFDNEGVALVFDAAEQAAEGGTGAEGGDDEGLILSGFGHRRSVQFDFTECRVGRQGLTQERFLTLFGMTGGSE